MRKYFYFRTETDEDEDDAAANSLMVPVDRFRGAIPSNSSAGTAANVITLFFESALSMKGAGQNNEHIIQDTVVLNVTEGKAKDVLVAIAEAANGHPHSDGVVVIGDDATTDFDGSTKAAVYVHPGITSVGTITQAAALS
jgi:hypothetical protein|tara:strand:+ start:1163 stop:1582 length:420 start_codon:yes stop_codon:yes gene_type:complete